MENIENNSGDQAERLAYYLSLPYRLEIIPDPEEGGYGASYPELPGCVTSAETLKDVIEMAADAKKEWIRASLEEGISVPLPEALEKYSGQFKLRIPKSLHRQLSEESRREGISMNQYCLYLLSKNGAVRK